MRPCGGYPLKSRYHEKPFFVHLYEYPRHNNFQCASWLSCLINLVFNVEKPVSQHEPAASFLLNQLPPYEGRRLKYHLNSLNTGIPSNSPQSIVHRTNSIRQQCSLFLTSIVVNRCTSPIARHQGFCFCKSSVSNNRFSCSQFCIWTGNQQQPHLHQMLYQLLVQTPYHRLQLPVQLSEYCESLSI